MTQERGQECNNQLASDMVSLFITGEEHSLLALWPGACGTLLLVCTAREA